MVFRVLTRYALAIAGGLTLPASAGADAWTRAATPHLQLLTNAGGTEARQAAVALERFRRHLDGVLPPRHRGPQAPVVVLAFRDAGSFRPFVPLHEGSPREADGFFQGGSGRSYIAVNLDAARPGRHDALFHEWAHLVLDQWLPAQPAWVSEGLAEVFSAWQPAGVAAVAGLARPEHLGILRERGLLPTEAVLRADYTSDLYNKPRSRNLFYAQAWALAHYLLLGRPGGEGRLHDYLVGLTQGFDAVLSFRQAFGEDLPAVEARLRAHLDSPTLPTIGLATADPGGAVAPSIDAPAPAEVEYLLGDLLLRERPRDARRHFSRALEADPGFAPAREGLARIELGLARWEEARAHLRAALERDPESPAALYQLAESLVREATHRSEVLSEEDTAQAVAALEKCVARAPHFTDAVHLLARLKPAPLRRRIALLEAAFTREPHRTALGVTLAGLYTRANDMARAVATLVRAREAARDDDMRFLATHLLGRVGFVAGLTAEARGTLRTLECLPGGGLDFLVEAQGGTLRLRAPSPVATMLYDADGEPVEKDLLCGAHAEPVTAWYRNLVGGEPAGADGTLLALTWLQW